MAVLATLRDKLRSGDIWVEHSSSYRRFDSYLLPSSAVPDAATHLGLGWPSCRRERSRSSQSCGWLEARDPDMHQTRKGQQWYFGMKLHVGVDSKTKLIHAMKMTAANVHDPTVLGSCCMERRRGCMATRRIGDKGR